MVGKREKKKIVHRKKLNSEGEKKYGTWGIW